MTSPPLRGLAVGAARRALAQRFRDAGLDAPEADARILLGHTLGLDRTALALADARVLTHAESDALAALAARRMSGEPVARLLGRWEFWGLSLGLNDDTLVPRPDTETLVETALALIDADGPRARPLRIADLGTGSGALLLALLSECVGAWGVATDISAGALSMARTNAQTLGLADRATFVRCDFGAALAGGFDLVVSNPPYIRSNDMAGLAPEVRRDPDRALDGGADGLDAYRTIAADARRLLRPGGWLVLELGAGQEADVAALLRAAGLSARPAVADLSGVPRALAAAAPY